MSLKEERDMKNTQEQLILTEFHFLLNRFFKRNMALRIKSLNDQKKIKTEFSIIL